MHSVFSLTDLTCLTYSMLGRFFWNNQSRIFIRSSCHPTNSITALKETQNKTPTNQNQPQAVFIHQLLREEMQNKMQVSVLHALKRTEIIVFQCELFSLCRH